MTRQKAVNPFDYGLEVEDVRILAVLHREKVKPSIEEQIEHEVRI